MSKQVNFSARDAALQSLAAACSLDATSSVAVCVALIGAFRQGAPVDEWKLAATAGYELAGCNLPGGFESYGKRLQANPKFWDKAETAGMALGPRLMLALGVPVLAKTGRKTGGKNAPKTEGKTEGKSEGKTETEVSNTLSALRAIRDVAANATVLRTLKGEPLPSAESARIGELLAECAALLSRHVK